MARMQGLKKIHERERLQVILFFSAPMLRKLVVITMKIGD